MSVGPAEAVVKARGITGKLMLSDALWAGTVIDKTKGKASTIKNFKLTDILHRGDVIWVKLKSIAGKQVLFSLEQEPEVEGAFVAIDAETGYVKALVGGFGFAKSDFNRALHAKRQPGSSFKPVVYAAALERGFTPATVINDEPVTYPGGPGGSWSPENSDHRHYGPTRLREALAYSRNVVTVKLVDMIGIDNLLDFARNLGITASLPRDLTIALGSMSMSPMEMATLYTSFANGGFRTNTITIKYVLDGKGRLLESNEPEATEVMSPQTAFLVTSMLAERHAVRNGGRAQIGVPAAGKTGTSNDYKDAWFVGYTPHLVGCAWVGYDDMKRSLGPGEVGGRAAAPIWANFMRGAIDSSGATDFTQPDGLIRVPIDAATGLLANDPAHAVQEFFREGTQPRSLRSPRHGRSGRP
ncbi:MAG: penicillin-binding transpeptidase domain-containing protein [Comamonadaceae bacterium]|nr:penicillin-binding transpeptidase domain-containing protein [Comamonadaceae bacterium]